MINPKSLQYLICINGTKKLRYIFGGYFMKITLFNNQIKLEKK